MPQLNVCPNESRGFMIRCKSVSECLLCFGYLRQTPVENPSAAAVFLCFEAQ